MKKERYVYKYTDENGIQRFQTVEYTLVTKNDKLVVYNEFNHSVNEDSFIYEHFKSIL